MRTVEVFAPAKVNLTLHVTGRRPDGYHLIDSLVSFATIGDRLTLRPAGTLSLKVDGPEAAGVPDGTENLVMKAAAALLHGAGAELILTKHLPAASGIGGGSSDAAAAIRGCLALLGAEERFQAWLSGSDTATEENLNLAASLGADVPMCLRPHPLRARGIGDRIEAVSLPRLPVVLVNPRVPLATVDVFRGLNQVENPPMPECLPDIKDADALIGFSSESRNDLQDKAVSMVSGLGQMLEELSGMPGCRLARMSGSGATCFGLFGSDDDANAALADLRAAHPAWWIAGGFLGDQTALATPIVS